MMPKNVATLHILWKYFLHIRALEITFLRRCAV